MYDTYKAYKVSGTFGIWKLNLFFYCSLFIHSSLQRAVNYCEKISDRKIALSSKTLLSKLNECPQKKTDSAPVLEMINFSISAIFLFRKGDGVENTQHRCRSRTRDWSGSTKRQLWFHPLEIVNERLVVIPVRRVRSERYLSLSYRQRDVYTAGENGDKSVENGRRRGRDMSVICAFSVSVFTQHAITRGGHTSEHDGRICAMIIKIITRRRKSWSKTSSEIVELFDVVKTFYSSRICHYNG